MIIIDANAILRYILNDNADMATKVRELLVNNKVTVRFEVIAEVVYVLTGVYKATREDVEKAIIELLDTERIYVESEDIVRYAITTYKTHSLDFVDCLLYAYQNIDGEVIYSFDKKLNKLLDKK